MRVFAMAGEDTKRKHKMKHSNIDILVSCAAVALVAGGFAITAHAATFTGELYGAYYADKNDCGIWHVEDSWKNGPDWRDDYVDVNGVKEPATWCADEYAFEVFVAPGEKFTAQVVHLTSTAAHIQSCRVLTDAEMFARYSQSDDEGDLRSVWPNLQTFSERAWVLVSFSPVTSGDTYTFDLSKCAIINDPDYPAYYNPADGAGGLSSKWTVESYAKKFGAKLAGTRSVTVSVSLTVKIVETGEQFPSRVWVVQDPYGAAAEPAFEKIDDRGGDSELIDAPGLYFVTPEMIEAQKNGNPPDGGDVDLSFYEQAHIVDRSLCDASGNVVGAVQLKIGKKNKKNGVKVSAAATLIIGGKAKKVSAKAVTLPLASDGTLSGDLAFKSPIGAMKFFADADGMFSLAKDGAYWMSSDTIGGNLRDGVMHFKVNMDKLPDLGDAGAILMAALPVDVIANVSGGKKLDFGKAATLKYKQDKASGANVLLGLDDAAKPNVSSLKLTYIPKTGLFKGSFKLYATSGEAKPKLKKFTVNVIGFIVDGKGQGAAFLKKPTATWSVVVE